MAGTSLPWRAGTSLKQHPVLGHTWLQTHEAELSQAQHTGFPTQPGSLSRFSTRVPGCSGEPVLPGGLSLSPLKSCEVSYTKLPQNGKGGADPTRIRHWAEHVSNSPAEGFSCRCAPAGVLPPALGMDVCVQLIAQSPQLKAHGAIPEPCWLPGQPTGMTQLKSWAVQKGFCGLSTASHSQPRLQQHCG